MANPLTGDYEAVVQIATRQINGLLATLHNNSDREARVKLIRNVVARIGDSRRRPPDLVDFRDWVIAFQEKVPGRGLPDLRSHVTATAPPGIAKTFTETADRFDDEWEIELPPEPPDVVRGFVKLQVSTVTITVPSGSSTEVTVKVHIRAKFYPDPGTNALPEPIHGEVGATYNVTTQPHGGGLRLIINPSSDDTKIQFVAAAGSGLSPGDQNRISRQVRKFVRESIVQQPIDVPAGFPFTEFKGLGSGSNQVIALPLQLSGGTPPANHLSSLTQSFIGSKGFALAVSKDRIIAMMDLAKIEREIEKRTVTVTIGYRWFSHTWTYNFHATPLVPSFHDGVIKITGKVDLVASGAPDLWLSFTQSIGLVLNAATQTVSVQRVGDPVVNESTVLPHGRMVTEVRTQFENALGGINNTINATVTSNRNKIVNGLNDLVPGVSASFTSLDVTTAGITLGGEITGGTRSAPVIRIEETHGGTAFTALQSWVPGGRIDRFTWSWVEYGLGASIWQGETRFSDPIAHEFIFPKPAGITGLSQICLRIEGTQVLPSGLTSSVVGGSTCLVKEPEFELDVPSWWGPLTVPLWQPAREDRGPLRRSIGGHVSVAATAPHDGKPQRPALVIFVGDGRLDSLLEALRRSKNEDSVATMAVVPAGTFDKSRSEVESLLGVADAGAAKLILTEDDEGAWTKAFDVTKTPSAYLMSAARELVWHSAGDLDPPVLAAALDKLAVRAKPSTFSPITLNHSVGDAPRNFTFADRGNQYALHHLRGREVVLNFWQSWSAPCLVELERLQSKCDGRKGPFVAAFHGGTSAEPIDEIRKRLKLSFPLVHDPQQRLARQFGIRCWPTTIKIAADGRIEHIQLGTTHDHGRSAPKAK